MLLASIVGSSMTFIDGTVVNVALPVLREKLDANLAQAQWIVEAYMLFLSSLLLVGGALGDRWGRRFAFIIGIVIFAAASAWCALAPDVTQLIVARAVQGVGAALLVPGSLALISANFNKESRGRAIGTWAAYTSIAAGLGPLLGGWLVEALSWRWIFFMNLPLAALVIAVVWRVPESRGETITARIDWGGVMLATLGLLGLVYGLTEGENRGFSDLRVLASLLLGAAALLAFALVELRVRHPMVPPELFRSGTFTGVNLLTFFLYGALGAMMFALPFNLIQAHGYSAVEAAAALLPFVLIMFLLSRWSGTLLDRYGSRLPLTLGPTVAAVGFFLFVRATGEGSYWSAVFPAVLGMSIGMAISVAPLSTTVMTAVDDRQAGLASGINNAVSRLAILLAVAIVGIVTQGSVHTGLDRIAWLSAAMALAGAACVALLVRPTNPR